MMIASPKLMCRGAGLLGPGDAFLRTLVAAPINVCLQQLLESSSQPVNMTRQMSHLAIDVVGKLALGYDLDTQTSEENRFSREL
ncbi:hypothetical protein NUW58_g10623 [Xylaria curta]|uniref:Uncharacterized protein n=1 Tax=Xylaria curta TaxID=42375 RepID=A0ACC1MK60_9PEZI|nr:hypothetical protein NUW58_g10623 [Xylaria curta]